MKYFVVILTIVLLITVTYFAAPNMDSHGSGSVLRYTKTDLIIIGEALESYKSDLNSIPYENDGLNSLVEKPDDSMDSWKLYLKKIPMDHWKNKYIYKVLDFDANKYSIYSMGADGIDSSGLKDDIMVGKNDYPCEIYHNCLTLRHYTFFTLIITIGASIFVVLLMLIFDSFRYIRKIRKNHEH